VFSDRPLFEVPSSSTGRQIRTENRGLVNGGLET